MRNKVKGLLIACLSTMVLVSCSGDGEKVGDALLVDGATITDKETAKDGVVTTDKETYNTLKFLTEFNKKSMYKFR